MRMLRKFYPRRSLFAGGSSLFAGGSKSASAGAFQGGWVGTTKSRGAAKACIITVINNNNVIKHGEGKRIGEITIVLTFFDIFCAKSQEISPSHEV
jgi:hypothetical protein